MRNGLILGSLAAVAITQAGCATQVKSLPLQLAVQQPAAGRGVALYFGSQAHPAVKQQLGDVSYSARVARGQDGAEASCNHALEQALDKLRAAAQQKNANAVIDVKTRFHDAETSSTTDFTCGVSPSAAAVAVRGDLAVLQSN
nr:signal peptidase [Burkholderia pyrrocinia]